MYTCMYAMWVCICMYMCIFWAILKQFVKFSSLINCRHRKQMISHLVGGAPLSLKI